MNKKIFLLMFGMIFLFGILGSVSAVGTPPDASRTVAYYPFQNTTGSVFDLTGNNPGTISGTVTRGVTGIYQNGFNFGGGYVDLGGGSSLNLNPSTNDISICAWIKTTNSSGMIVGKDGGTSSNNQYQFFMASGNIKASYGGATTVVSTSTYNDNAWHFACMTGVHGGGEVKLYVDDSPTGTPATSGTNTYSGDAVIGNRPASSFPFSGNVDEVQIYNYTLNQTQIDYLYNLGSPNASQEYPFSANRINLNSPLNGTFFNSNSVTFNWTLTNGSGIVNNETLFLNGTAQTVISSGVNGTQTYTNSSVPDGVYNWRVIAYINGTQINSSTNTFTIDTQPPTINITNPSPNNTLIDYQVANTNLQFNWTVTDTHLSTCWVEYGGTNHTVTCSANTTNINITSPSVNNATFYANDTAGNLASLERSWGYKVFQNSVNYTSSTLSGATGTFILNITIDPSLSLGTSYLVYNGTAYLGTVSTSGTNKIITSSINIPTVSTATNVTFYWNNTLSDGSTITTNSYNQTINPFLIGSCGTYSNHLYNFTIYDEGDQHKLANTTTEALFNLYSSDRSRLIANYSVLSTSNPTLICANVAIPVGVSYSLDGTVKYTSNESSYDTEYYNILSYDLTNSSANQNIALYSLLSADETDFQVTVTGQNFLPAQNAIIYVQRQYISQNKFITVEAPKTDSNGQTILHLVRNSVTYNLVVQNATNGTIITELDNILAYCSDPTTTSCIINLNAFTSSTLPQTYDNIIGLAYSGPTYNTTSRVVTFGFTTTDSTAKNVTMEVLKYDQIGNTTACTNSLTSASGTLSCNVPSSIGSSSITINIYVNGMLVLTNIVTGQGSNLGESGYVFVFFLMIMLVLMAAGDKNVTLIVMIIGLVIATGIAVINGSVLARGSSVGFAIIAIGILLWKLNKDKQD